MLTTRCSESQAADETRHVDRGVSLIAQGQQQRVDLLWRLFMRQMPQAGQRMEAGAEQPARQLKRLNRRRCRYHCDPAVRSACEDCARLKSGAKLKTEELPVPVVDLPLGASEDRVVGALDLERALSQGIKVCEPGLLARAHRGFLYIDEVNLLEDHLVDLQIDVAASGENVIEREGLSVRHPARFVLVGSGNPEEGELRPQLLDRFGLSVEVKTPTEIAQRVEVVRRRDAFERDPADFAALWAKQDVKVRQILQARERLPEVAVGDGVLYRASELCVAVSSDGLRGELSLIRAARALAALQAAPEVTQKHLRQIAVPALRHRLRRIPLDDTGSADRIERAVAEPWT